MHYSRYVGVPLVFTALGALCCAAGSIAVKSLGISNVSVAGPPRSSAVLPRNQSQITSILPSGSQSVGTFGGVAYTRTWGVVSGIAASDEDVHGLETLPHNRDGNYEYKSQFEIIAPAKPNANSTVVVEAENRGMPVFLNSVNGIAVRGGPLSDATYKLGLGNGFLFEHGISYARVQWQTGVASDVPKDAEGVGEVIVRDFGRLLAGRTKPTTDSGFDPGIYHRMILVGISLSGFFVNTFIAEGFNAVPMSGRAVFDGAIAVDGVGNWLALNQLAAENGSPEFPYVVPNGKPLQPAALLKRPRSDPFYIDIANYTDFYRLRASATDLADLPARMRRYDWPSPHIAAPGGGSGISAPSRCNAGVPVILNPISYSPYLRAVTLELKNELVSGSAKGGTQLPPSTMFNLGSAPASSASFNSLPGSELKVPLVDDDDQPIGGVRFPEVVHPLGRPKPVSLPPSVTTSISETCGNFGGWQPFTAEELHQRYRDQSNYLSLYSGSLDELIAAGYLLAADRPEMLEAAASLYSGSER